MSKISRTNLAATVAGIIGCALAATGPSGGAILFGAEVGCLLQVSGATSLQLDPPSQSYIALGAKVRVSGSLSKSGVGLAGKPVVLRFASPRGDVHEKKVITDSRGKFFCDYAPSSAGNWIIEANYREAASDSYVSTQSQGSTDLSAETFLTANLSAGSIVTGSSLSVKGALRSQDYLDPSTQILAGQTITLTLYDPTGTPVEFYTTTTVGTGRYDFLNILLTADGKWFLRVQFEGDPNLNPSSTQLLPVRARPSAGYAIIVAGKVQGGTGLESHNKTTDRAYKKFKRRGFSDDDIYYFRYGTPADATIMVDEEPREKPDGNGNLGIREAIVTWAKHKMNSANGPLYILFVNHGNDEKFYVDPSAPDSEDEIIDPGELDDWTSQLEDSLAGEAVEEEIVFMYGACYSGSFIPALSHEGKRRIIITSADPKEQSFKGPMEADGVRDGEFFVTQLFAALGQGLNLKRGFEVATKATEAYTSNASGNGGVSDSFYADDAAQHPLLDDNGDDIGSNDALSTYPGNDGAVSAKIILGYEHTTSEPVRLTSVSPAQHLSATDEDPILEAKVSDSDRTAEIWVAIKPPGFDLGTAPSGVSEQRELGVPHLNFDSQPETGTFALYDFNKDGFSGFNASGRYEILYFVKDAQTDSISVLKRSFVYRSLNATDGPPQPFELLEPGDGSMQNTILFLDWEDSVDPENETVSYTVEISTAPSFAAPEFVIEGIDGSGVMIDELVGLSDLTHYYWRAIAVDPNGNRTFSSQTRSFDTNDTNAWGNYNILSSIVRNYNDPSTWPPDSWIEIQPYVGKVYNHYYSAMVPLGGYSVDSEAPQFSHEHDDVEVIEESPTTLLQLPEPNSGTVSGAVKDSSTLSPIRGATVRLEVTSGIYTGTQFNACSGDDGSFQIPDLFGAVVYEITVEKNFYTSHDDTFSLAAGENKDVGTVQISFDDADNDGLPDSFEQIIVDTDPGDDIEDIWDVLSADDFDSDAMTNGAECAASTDPTSADSFLRMTSTAKQANGDITITWASESGVYYEIHYTDDLLTWVKAEGPIASSGTGTTSWTDDGSATTPPPAEATRRCYRVQVY